MSRPLPKAAVRLCQIINILVDAKGPMTVTKVINELEARHKVRPVHSTVWADLTSLANGGLVKTWMPGNDRLFEWNLR